MSTYSVGTIIVSLSGYDQTNINFYRIQRRSGNTVWLLPLHGRRSGDIGFMQGTTVPGEPKAIGDFEVGSRGCRWDGKLIRRTLKYRGAEPIGFSIKRGWASAWDGQPVQWTAYA